MIKIGLGITVHNRNDVAKASLIQWLKYMPFNCKVRIVDDASDVPFPFADYRFEENVGIAVAKNKCLSLLDDCDYIFLIDDDIIPLSAQWCFKYIESGLDHAMYIFDRNEDKAVWNEFRSYQLPRGPFLFFTKKCLQTVGGFDAKFNHYAYEHPELSRRIFNMGLTPAPYIDIYNSEGLFYSHDEHNTIQSSVPDFERAQYIRQNKAYFEATKNSNIFVPYK